MSHRASPFFRRRLVAAMIAALPVLAVAGHDDSDKDRDHDRDRGGFRDHDRPDFRELNAQWWQWAMSIPTSGNPLVETTTAGPSNCAAGQRGPVWFLGGIFGGGTVSRLCTLPQNVALYFPIINVFQYDSPGVCGQKADEHVTIRDIRRNVAPFVDGATDIVATIDSRPIRTVKRVRSVPFVATFPADNIFLNLCSGKDVDPPGNPAGVYSPSADDGYYAYIDSLSPGDHVLQFSAKSGEFNINVTYQLKVMPVSLR